MNSPIESLMMLSSSALITKKTRIIVRDQSICLSMKSASIKIRYPIRFAVKILLTSERRPFIRLAL